MLPDSVEAAFNQFWGRLQSIMWLPPIKVEAQAIFSRKNLPLKPTLVNAASSWVKD